MKRFRRMKILASAAMLAGVAVAGLAGGSAGAKPAALTLFDSHAHLVSDNQQTYPRPTAGGPPPGGGALPPGVGGQSGGHYPAEPRADPDAARVVVWMKQEHVDGLVAVQKRGTYGFDNRYILDSASKYPHTFVPVVVLDSEDAKTPGLITDWARTRRLSAIRLTGIPAADGSIPWLESPAALRTWDAAEAAGLVVEVMIADPRVAGPATAVFQRLAMSHPHVRLVIDHVGYPDVKAPGFGIDAQRAALARQKNIYYKVTTINFDILREDGLSIPAFVRKMVDVYGADHLMWGSDLGNSGGAYPELVSRAIASTAKLTPRQRTAILHDTASRVFVPGGIPHQ